MITSTDNPQLKVIAKLLKSSKFRREEGAFVLEGPRMIKETPTEFLHKIYLSESKAGDYDYPDAEIVSDKVFASVSDTVNPQGVLAVAKMPSWDEDEILSVKDGLFIFLEGLQDPGNLGTILRTAEAAGCTGIIADKNTVDIYNPKVVRSTMGAVYRVPYVTTEDFAGTLGKAKKAKITVFAAHLDGRDNYFDCDYTHPAAFLIGNEGGGLSEEASASADKKIIIPMEGQAESLNAAMAAGILLYEAKRQRMNENLV